MAEEKIGKGAISEEALEEIAGGIGVSKEKLKKVAIGSGITIFALNSILGLAAGEYLLWKEYCEENAKLNLENDINNLLTNDELCKSLKKALCEKFKNKKFWRDS